MMQEKEFRKQMITRSRAKQFMMLHMITIGLSLISVATGLAKNDAIDRRNALAALSAGIGSGFLLTGLPPSGATEKAAQTFAAYNIIPDSVNFDPRLEAVEPVNFLKSLASIKAGGSIWLGEHHNSKRDHQFQAEFVRSFHTERAKGSNPKPMAIGLEQVQTQFQAVLDAYIDGTITLQQMKEGVDWEKRWMWDFEGYRPIFETAKDLKIKLLALNVDSEDLSMVEKEGYPGLPLSRLRKYIKDPIGFGEFAKTRQFSTYVDYVISPSYEIHQQLGILQYTITGEKLPDEMTFRRFLSARILWDEGMASAASTWCSENPGGLMLGLVGADHVKFTDGIPGRFKRMSGPDVACISVIINPTLIDSRPSGSVANVPGSDSSQSPETITLQLRYLKDGVDPNSEARRLPESSGGVLEFSDYIIVTS